jgi:hypothetical protein
VILVADIIYVKYTIKNAIKNTYTPVSNMLVKDEKYSFNLIKNKSGHLGCKKNVVTTLASGLRTTGSLYPENKNIHIFGDSFAFGFNVNDDEAFPSLLNKKVNNYNILNYGVPGWGIIQMYLRTMDALENIKEGDIVIWTPIYEDLFRDMYTPESISKMLLFSNLNIQKFPKFNNSNISLEDIDTLYFSTISHLFLSRFVGSLFKNLFSYEDKSEASSLKMMRLIERQILKKGAQFKITMLPSEGESFNFLANKEHLFKNTKSYISVLNAFYKNDMSKIFECEGHYSSLGNKWVSNLIYKIILKELIVNSSV